MLAEFRRIWKKLLGHQKIGFALFAISLTALAAHADFWLMHQTVGLAAKGSQSDQIGVLRRIDAFISNADTPFGNPLVKLQIIIGLLSGMTLLTLDAQHPLMRIWKATTKREG